MRDSVAGGTVDVRAFAKINLTLRVLARRADGFHDLRTTFQSLALHDTLRFRAASGPFEIECDDADCPTDRTNLVWRAAEKMWRLAGRRGMPGGLRVRIQKRIPLQSGLGGGSSDAAAALRALSVLWRLKGEDRRVRSIAAELGADVPFFLDGGTALGVERGDLLFPLVDWPAAWVVLVLPTFGVSTKDAYTWWDDEARSHAGDAGGAWGPPIQGARVVRRATELAPFRDSGNDLQPPVVARHREVGRYVAALAGVGASYAAMSGSGSAVFGLFESQKIANAAARRLTARAGRVMVTRTLSRAQYRVLAQPRSAVRGR